MKRTLRLFSLTVILLIVIQIITLHYFGKSALIRKIQEDNSELLTGTDRGIAIPPPQSHSSEDSEAFRSCVVFH